MSHIANKIDAEDKNLGELLHNKRFRIDVFQREYKWGKRQIEDLISDVTNSFLKCYDSSDELANYDNYDCYYMGPVVLCHTNKDISIIDGQQRLTSFSLLLIYLRHLVKQMNLPIDEMRSIDDYIYVRKGGTKTLVLNIEQRKDVMTLLMRQDNQEELINQSDRYELSNRNLIDRYIDVYDLFPNKLKEPKALQTFIDWLLDKVIFVQINAYSMDNAYTIFETMNDRGLNLSPSEILKGFLLSKIIEGREDNNDKADDANEFWNGCISALHRTLGYDNSDLDFFKAWFRAKYAETKRQTKAGSENEDFEIIGTQFHSWVKNNIQRMGLKTNDDYYYFIKSDLEFYSNLYQRIYTLKRFREDGFEAIYENSFFTIADSLYYPLFLAAVSKRDDTEYINGKIQNIGQFVERYSNMRLLQNKSISQPVIRNNIYDLVKKIRNIDLTSLKDIFQEELSYIYSSTDLKHIRIYNEYYLKYIMARITCKIFSNYGKDELLEAYLPSRRKNAFILCSIQDDNTEDNIDSVDNSEISNHVLIRRSDVNVFKSKRFVWERLTFIQEKGYTPEVSFYPKSVEEFFNVRQTEFAQILKDFFFT